MLKRVKDNSKKESFPKGVEILLEKLWERYNCPGASLISPLPGILALNISPQRITALR